MDLRVILDQIKSCTDLRQIIPDVQKKGSEYFVLCPFHEDGKPSCHVNKEFFHCFGCGKTGDIITYYRDGPAKMEFSDALRVAALDAGVTLDDKIDQQIQQMIDERNKRQEALDFYRTKYEDSEKAQSYLRNRGLSDETVAHFELGYRPDWDAIAIPIFSKSGNLDSISFRYLDPNNEQRYYHKNNLDFKKGDCLYNSRSIEFGEGPICVCEGMFDVMSIYQAGYQRVVGIMGGALNDTHVKEFGNSSVVFVPDRKKEGDFDLFKKSVFRLRKAHPDLTINVAILPDGDANSVDPEVLKAAIANAEGAELAILKADLEGLDRDAEYKMARRIASDITDPLTKDDIVRWLAARWDKDREVVKAALSRSETAAPSRVLTVTDALDELERREREDPLDGVTFDVLGLGGLITRPHTSQVAIVAARANVGKTLLACNMLNAGREWAIPSLFLSMEQPASEIMFRLSLMASADLQPMNSDQLSALIRQGSEEWSQGLRTLVEFSYPNLRMMEQRLTPEGVRDAIIDASYSMGEKVKVVYIDYIGLMGHAMRSNDSYERMSAIGRDIQAVTKEMDVLGIYLMQLSRKGGDGSEPVTLDMMRDSGVIEEVADYIIGAWRDKDRNQYADTGMSKMYTNVCKNRHGKTGSAEMWLDMATLKLSKMDYRQAASVPDYGYDGSQLPVDASWEE